jgi:hypothetical protein
MGAAAKSKHKKLYAIGRLVKNEQNIEMAIADEIQNFKEYGGYER